MPLIIGTSALLLTILAGVADRIRGDGFGYNRNLEKLFYGWIIATIAGVGLSVWTIPIAILFALGSTFGWGMPFGWYLFGRDPIHHNESTKEWWQVGSLWKHPFISLIVRGILWGLPLLTVAYWVPVTYVIAGSIAVAFPLSAFISKHTVDESKWEVAETLRGFLCGVLIVACMFFI